VSTIAAAGAARRPGDRYLMLLACALAGYAILGKGFAYLGVPPLFVGEIVLMAGCVTVLRMGGIPALFAFAPGLLLAVLMAWTLVRTLPFVPVYGMDAPRDSVIIMYGLFAFVVTALLLDDPRRLDTIVGLYDRFLLWFVPLVPVLFAASWYLRPLLPSVPGTDVPVIQLGPGEVPVHMAGAAVFVMAGFRRVRLAWILALAAAAVMTSVLTRGGMLAFLLAVGVAAVAMGKLRQTLTALLAAGALLAAAYATESALGEFVSEGVRAERPLSATQIVKNVGSIFGTKDPSLEASREWRLQWWHKIVDDTVCGDRFWNGAGFGVNLALASGYGDPRDSEPLRSPHNAHMTILARAGVPGAALWFVFLVLWAGTIVRAFLEARRDGEEHWVRLFLWVGCYALACLVNATFDVALEGPMQGVWFWCLIGLGNGAAMLFRCRPRNEQRSVA
jgi:hypothetical protein